MSEQPTFTFDNGSASAVLDLRVYRAIAAKKAAYRLADKCGVAFGMPSDGQLAVTLLFKAGTSEPTAMSVARLFLEELLDQELREEIATETIAIRTLILAHAFSKTALIRHE